ncbi:unnamed protein product [Rhodiola kirilowii]
MLGVRWLISSRRSTMLPLDDVHAALNGVLPDDIRVRELSPALPEFHARFSVESKIYHYKIYNDCCHGPISAQLCFPQYLQA